MTEVENTEINMVGEVELTNEGTGEHKQYGKTPEYNVSYFAGVINDVL